MKGEKEWRKDQEEGERKKAGEEWGRKGGG